MSTAEALTATPSLDGVSGDELYEIIDGVVVEKPPMSVDAQGTASDIAFALTSFGLAHNLGKAYPEMLIKLSPSLDRRPDVIFVSFARWPRGRALPRTTAWDIVPDLCVEVVSPTNRADDLRGKLEEYFEAGIPLVWVVYPRVGVVDVHDSASGVRTVRRDGALDGGAVLPGFVLKLADLFPEPEPEPPADAAP